MNTQKVMYVVINFLKDEENELIVGINFSSNLEKEKTLIDNFVNSRQNSTSLDDEDVVQHIIRVYEVEENFKMTFDSEVYQEYFCESKVIYEGIVLQNGW